MADAKTLEDLASLQGAETAALPARKIDAQGRAYATGKRKNAVARVWIKPGVGRITVNAKAFDQYFARSVWSARLTLARMVNARGGGRTRADARPTRQ